MTVTEAQFRRIVSPTTRPHRPTADDRASQRIGGTPKAIPSVRQVGRERVGIDHPTILTQARPTRPRTRPRRILGFPVVRGELVGLVGFRRGGTRDRPFFAPVACAYAGSVPPFKDPTNPTIRHETPRISSHFRGRVRPENPTTDPTIGRVRHHSSSSSPSSTSSASSAGSSASPRTIAGCKCRT